MYTLANKLSGGWFYLRSVSNMSGGFISTNRMKAVRFKTKAEAEFALHRYKQQVPNTNMKVKRW